MLPFDENKKIYLQLVTNIQKTCYSFSFFFKYFGKKITPLLLVDVSSV